MLQTRVYCREARGDVYFGCWKQTEEGMGMKQRSSLVSADTIAGEKKVTQAV